MIKITKEHIGLIFLTLLAALVTWVIPVWPVLLTLSKKGLIQFNLGFFILIFIILTLAHPLGDFLAPWRQQTGEWWLVLNPLHFLFDRSRFRKHPAYVHNFYDSGIGTIQNPVYYTMNPSYRISMASYNMPDLYEIKPRFWRWLGVDQFIHQVLNLVYAFILAFSIWFVAFFLTYSTVIYGYFIWKGVKEFR